jgi:16S rRNA (uracil1498-N3)-methyltransferase
VNLAEFARRVAALAQFRVESPAQPVLSREDEHHLRKVLRANAGEEVVVTDGRGSWSICEVLDVGLARVSDVHQDPPAPETTLYLTPLKGDRSEWAVAKATEVGVSRIVPLIAARMSVKFKGESREKTLARWRRIADESAGQCRRTYDVTIADPVRVDEVHPLVAVADLGADGNWAGLRSVAIGPEGGWASDEWDLGRRRVGLGPTVLRAETAGVVAASLLTFQAGSWGFTFDGVRNE